MAECDAAIAAAKKAGVRDDAELEIYAVDQLFAADKRGPHSGTRMIPVSDAPKVCAAYAAALDGARLPAAVTAAYQLASWMTLVKPEEVPSTATELAKKPAACVAAIDAALAAGKPGGTKITVEGAEVTLDEARARCQQILEDATRFQDAVNTRLEAEAAKRAAKYKAAGIKGDRLELFAYYDMEWYYPGCRRSTGDPKKLKAARALFQWLTAPDGTITIRKFTFRGDKYTVRETTHATEASAYAGCR